MPSQAVTDTLKTNEDYRYACSLTQTGKMLTVEF
jgi:hypothetical protein